MRVTNQIDFMLASNGQYIFDLTQQLFATYFSSVGRRELSGKYS